MAARSFDKLGRLEAFDIAGQVGPGDPGRQEAGWPCAGLRRAGTGRRTGRLRRGYSLRYCSKFSIARAGIPGREAGAAHREEDLARRARAFGELARLGHELVGGVRVGLNEGVVGFQQFLSERLVNARELVFARTGQQADGLVASQLLGGRPVTGGQLDARQLEPDLGGPAARRGWPRSPCAGFPGPRRAGPTRRSAMA